MAERSPGCERASCTRAGLCKSARHLCLWSSLKNNLALLLPSCPIHQFSVYAEFISLIRVDFMHDLSPRMFPARITYQTTFLTHSEPEHFSLPPFLSLNRIHSFTPRRVKPLPDSWLLTLWWITNRQTCPTLIWNVSLMVPRTVDTEELDQRNKRTCVCLQSKGRCSPDCNWSALHVHKHLRDAQFTADVSSSFVIFKSLLHALLFHLSCFNAVFM